LTEGRIEDHLNDRLKETLAEAKRHFKNYQDMRAQHNDFIEGRLNKFVEYLMTNPTAKYNPQKLHMDLI
jgi:hypothetical protein